MAQLYQVHRNLTARVQVWAGTWPSAKFRVGFLKMSGAHAMGVQSPVPKAEGRAGVRVRCSDVWLDIKGEADLGSNVLWSSRTMGWRDG